MTSTKESIRKKILSLRSNLTEDEAQRRSALIFQNLKKLPIFNSANVIHTYVSSKKNEVDTIEIIKYLFSIGKRVIVPVVDKENKTLIHSELKNLSELKRSTFGLLEPGVIREVNLDEVDIVIVPAVAVDRKGNRIGFGGGYYDKFLKQINCPKIVLVYEFQVVEEIEPERSDVPVDFIVTENDIIKCGGSKS